MGRAVSRHAPSAPLPHKLAKPASETGPARRAPAPGSLGTLGGGPKVRAVGAARAAHAAGPILSRRPGAPPDRSGKPSVRVVVPYGRLLGEEAAALQRRLGEALADGVDRVVVDLRQTGHVGARALGVLAAHLSKLRRRGGDLKLLGLSVGTSRTLELCGLGGAFECLASEEDIARSFGLSRERLDREGLWGAAAEAEGACHGR